MARGPLPRRPEEMECWILAGQSNMQGCGLLAEALEPDERVWSFSTAGRWEVACEPLHRHHESFAETDRVAMEGWLAEARRTMSAEDYETMLAKPPMTGAGPGLSFGVAMADALDAPIGLLPTAFGGTSLGQWSHERKTDGADCFYGAMLERVRRSEADVRGLLWYQGESDAGPGASEPYGARMAAWIEAAREDLGVSDLPVVVVQISRLTVLNPDWETGAKHWDLVRQALYDLPDRAANVGVTSAIDLGMVDWIHIDAPSAIRLGRRLARVALAMTGRGGTMGARVEAVETVDIEHPAPGRLRVRCSNVTGAWHPSNNMAGFGVFDAEGRPSTTNAPINAFRDPDDPTAIRVHLNEPLREGERLGYGQGLDPYCNVTDEADMPLCAFLDRVE